MPGINKFIFWMPRILAILFILFLAMFSLDVFDSASSFGEILTGLFMHNIPVLILLTVLVISWKYEIVGGVAFIFAGVLYIFILLMSDFQFHMLLWILQISGPAFLVGILFLINWNQKKKRVRWLMKR